MTRPDVSDKVVEQLQEKYQRAFGEEPDSFEQAINDLVLNEGKSRDVPERLEYIFGLYEDYRVLKGVERFDPTVFNFTVVFMSYSDPDHDVAGHFNRVFIDGNEVKSNEEIAEYELMNYSVTKVVEDTRVPTGYREIHFGNSPEREYVEIDSEEREHRIQNA